MYRCQNNFGACRRFYMHETFRHWNYGCMFPSSPCHTCTVTNGNTICSLINLIFQHVTSTWSYRWTYLQCEQYNIMINTKREKKKNIIISPWQTVGFLKGEYVKCIQVKTNVQHLLLKGEFCKNIFKLIQSWRHIMIR